MPLIASLENKQPTKAFFRLLQGGKHSSGLGQTLGGSPGVNYNMQLFEMNMEHTNEGLYSGNRIENSVTCSSTRLWNTFT